MKGRTVLWSALALALCLVLPTTGEGATFVYQSGNFTITGFATVDFGDTHSSQTFGPESGQNVQDAAHADVRVSPFNISHAGIFASGNSGASGVFLNVEFAIAGAAGFGHILVAYNTQPGPPFSNSAGATVSTGTGLSYRVMPGAGENFGDLGTLYLGNFFNGQASASYGQLQPGWVNLTLNPTIVTVNGTPVYSRPEYNGYYFHQGLPSQPEAFPIKIGDIVGITMGGEVSAADANTDVGIDGMIENFAEIFLGEDFTPAPAPLPSSLLLLGSGLLGLAGLSLRKY